MNKRLLLKVFVLCVLFCQLVNKANAQYAIGGTASPDLQKSVYWLTWSPGLFGLTPQTGASASSIINGTYTWQYSSTVKIVAVISDPTTTITQTGLLKAYTPGEWVGDGLDLMYSGNNLAKGAAAPLGPSLGVYRSALVTEDKGLKRFDIAISVQILINGQYETVKYPGMVIADAEALAWSTASPARHEYFSGTTNGPTAWQLLNLRVDGVKALNGAINQNGYVMDLTPDGKSFNIHLTNAAAHDAGVQAVMYAHGASSLSDVTLRGDGKTAIALGLVLPFDLGDATADYGRPENYITTFEFGSKPLPTGTNMPIKAMLTTPGLATLRPKAKAYMSPVENTVGEHSFVDADGDIVANTLGTADNLSNVNDENALTSTDISALNLKVNRGDNVTLTIPSIVNNEVNTLNQPVPVYLDGWIDFNNDKKFTANERATTVTINPNTTALNTNLVFPQTNFTNNNIQFGSSTFLRLRLSKNQLTNWDTNTAVDDASISSADGGETEDYKLPDLTGVVISGNVFHDANGATGGISGPAITAFTQYAYLVNNTTNLILQKVQVSGTGTYAFTQVNNGTYRVVISSSNAPSVGGTISGFTLPTGWSPSADGFGSFNAQGSGVESGTPDLQILITPQIIGAGNDVTGVNFGINQHPVAVDDLAIPANTNTATTKNLITNDTDADGGTINPATVVIENPATPTVYGVSGFATGDGIYALDAFTGVVTFTSTGEFAGTTTPAIKYKVNDNFGSTSNIGTFSFTVKIGGVADATSTTINTPVSYNVKTNDGTAANTGTVTVTPQPGATSNGGTVVTDPADATKLKYTPSSTFAGVDTYTYTLTKNSVTSDPITVTVTVKPTGVADSETTLINTPVITAVTGNDGASVALAPLDPTSISTPSSGTAVIDTDPTKIKYTPATNFVGVATYTYRLKTTAGGVLSDPITVTVDVKPTGVADPESTPINTPVITAVTGNDGASVALAPLDPTSISTPSSGTAVIDTDPTKIKYTPATNFVGVATYTYRLKTTAGGVLSDPITVTVDVKPTGVADPESTPINTPVITAVTGNDGPSALLSSIDPTSISTPSSGTAVIDTDPTKIKYTPATNFVGVATYTYRLKTTAGGVLSDPITVTVDVKPTGVADPESTPINTPVITAVTGNDGPSVALASIDPTSISTPSSGTAVIDADPTKIKYTPATDFVGVATYTYKLKTTLGGISSDPITVTVSVKPTGQPDVDNTTIEQTVTTNVLTGAGADAPGTNPGGATVITDITPTVNALSAVISGPSRIAYTPAAGFIGIDTYTYRLTAFDGIKSDPITVTITVKPKGVNDVASTDVNTPVTTIVTSNDGPSGDGTATVTAGTAPTKGGIVVNGTSITYTPNAGYVGSDTYTYTLTKNGILSDPITVFVNVGMTGSPDVDITTVNTPVATVVTTNDGVSGTGSIITAGSGSNGTTSVSGGTVTYTPNLDFIGVDTYTYTLTKNSVSSAPITVTITVKPKGVNDVVSTTVNTPVPTIVTSNDGPSGATPVTVTAGTAPIHGTIAVSGTTITYTPNAGYLGNDTYTYTLTKSTIVSDPITVSVSVTALPTGVNDTDVTQINTPVSTVVIGNDGSSGTGSTVAAGSGLNGTTSVSGGTVTYTPNLDFIGIDTYTYTLTKNSATSAPITVTITVKPKGTNDIVTTVINTPVTTTVTGNDGPSGVATVTVTAGTLPTNGNIAVSGTSITYTPNTGYLGNDTYTYTLTKNTVVSDPITVSVTVTPPIPVGIADNDLTPVNTPVVTNVIANDGADGTGATVTATAGSNGTTTVNGGNVTYTPANGYIGTDTYTYTLTKGTAISAPITVTINVYSATMSLSKVANNGATKAGDVINYTLILKNTGTVVLSNVVLTDAGADVGSISPASIATLAPGASATATANHTVVAADVSAGKFSNQATATATDPKNNPVSKISDDPSTTIFDDPTVVPIIPVAPASINLAKTGVFSGNQVNYTFIVTNNGGVALNTITLTDNKLGLNGITITAPAGGLLPNASLTYNATYTLTQADKDLGTVSNTATVSAKDPGNNTITGTGSTVTTVTTSPIATNDVEETNSGIPVIVSILTNDDPKGSTFNLTSIEIVSTPMHGTVVANADGTVTYTPTAGYTGTDSFTYRVKDAFGYYTNAATVTVTTNLVVELKIPTLFSPNGDGVNDGFVIKDLGDYAQNELIVINRWGNEVYRQPNYQNTWSGTGLNEGTYFYIVRLKKANGDSWLIRKGYVTLIRTFKK